MTHQRRLLSSPEIQELISLFFSVPFISLINLATAFETTPDIVYYSLLSNGICPEGKKINRVVSTANLEESQRRYFRLAVSQNPSILQSPTNTIVEQFRVKRDYIYKTRKDYNLAKLTDKLGRYDEKLGKLSSNLKDFGRSIEKKK